MDRIRALVRRLLTALRLAPTPPPAAPPPARAGGAAYRTPAQREHGKAPVTPARPPPTQDEQLTALLRHVHQPILHFARGGPELTRLDPPGLLDAWSIAGVRQWFWQYDCRTAIL